MQQETETRPLFTQFLVLLVNNWCLKVASKNWAVNVTILCPEACCMVMSSTRPEHVAKLSNTLQTQTFACSPVVKSNPRWLPHDDLKFLAKKQLPPARPVPTKKLPLNEYRQNSQRKPTNENVCPFSTFSANFHLCFVSPLRGCC